MLQYLAESLILCKISPNSLVSRKNVSIAEKVLFNFHKNNTAAAVYGALPMCVLSGRGSAAETGSRAAKSKHSQRY